MLPRLSYQLKVPLTFSLIVLIVATTVATTLVIQAYHDSKYDLLNNAQILGRSLARTLAPLVLHDDVWASYEAVTAPLNANRSSMQQAIVVLDAHNKIYVSSDPHRFPLSMAISDLVVSPTSTSRNVSDSDLQTANHTSDIKVAVPIEVEGGRIGTVVLLYKSDIFLARFFHAVEKLALITFAILALLLPLGWYLGRRMVEPLVRLTQCMDKLGTISPGHLQCQLPLDSGKAATDEIARLWLQFIRMIDQLKEKERLQNEMIRANRLAAIGRMTAGIAHEINNPLGGMLNAISTFKRQGIADPFVGRTMSLLERGLLQIKDVVGALLVQAKIKSRALTPTDIEDVRTLVSASVSERCLALKWQNEIFEPLPLPATMVRQIVLNLLLNAIHAVHDNGHVCVRVWLTDGKLAINVENDGEFIEPEKMEHLLEPFSNGNDHHNGLGLWVVYQILQQLKGDIQVLSGPGNTRFEIRLPMEQTYAAA